MSSKTPAYLTACIKKCHTVCWTLFLAVQSQSSIFLKLEGGWIILRGWNFRRGSHHMKNSVLSNIILLDDGDRHHLILLLLKYVEGTENWTWTFVQELVIRPLNSLDVASVVLLQKSKFFTKVNWKQQFKKFWNKLPVENASFLFFLFFFKDSSQSFLIWEII